MPFFGVHRDETMVPISYLKLNISFSFPLHIIVGIILNFTLLLAYRVTDTIAVEWLYAFHRFKANYLLAHHVNDISMKDVNDLAKSQQKHYKKKKDAMEAEIIANYEQQVYESQLNNYPPIDLNGGDICVENIEETGKSGEASEGNDSGAGVTSNNF